jgi:hypothetical protein
VFLLGSSSPHRRDIRDDRELSRHGSPYKRSPSEYRYRDDAMDDEPIGYQDERITDDPEGCGEEERQEREPSLIEERHNPTISPSQVNPWAE